MEGTWPDLAVRCPRCRQDVCIIQDGIPLRFACQDGHAIFFRDLPHGHLARLPETLERIGFSSGQRFRALLRGVSDACDAGHLDLARLYEEAIRRLDLRDVLRDRAGGVTTASSARTLPERQTRPGSAPSLP